MGATIAMFGILFCWFGYWIHLGLSPASIPFIGSDLSGVLGVVVFNYTFVVTLPSWVNEKVRSCICEPSIVFVCLHVCVCVCMCVRA